MSSLRLRAGHGYRRRFVLLGSLGEGETRKDLHLLSGGIRFRCLHLGWPGKLKGLNFEADSVGISNWLQGLLGWLDFHTFRSFR